MDHMRSVIRIRIRMCQLGVGCARLGSARLARPDVHARHGVSSASAVAILPTKNLKACSQR